MQAIANVNGQQMPLAEVRVSAMDRGFLFGDAVYEVLRIYRGKPFLLQEHMQRLARSLQAIFIEGVDLSRLEQRLLATIAAGPFVEALAYIQITRGAAATRTHGFPTAAKPLELLFVEPFQDSYRDYRQTGVAVVTRPDFRWGRCDIKSTNLLGNVLAALEARQANAVEAIFYLPDGTLTEGCRTTLFGVLNSTLRTHPCGNRILPGVTRDLVLRLAKQCSIRGEENPLSLDDLPAVTELFLTGTTAEVLPINRVDGKPVGAGQRGPVTRQLQEAFQRYVLG